MAEWIRKRNLVFAKVKEGTDETREILWELGGDWGNWNYVEVETLDGKIYRIDLDPTEVFHKGAILLVHIIPGTDRAAVRIGFCHFES